MRKPVHLMAVGNTNSQLDRNEQKAQRQTTGNWDSEEENGCGEEGAGASGITMSRESCYLSALQKEGPSMETRGSQYSAQPLLTEPEVG